MKTFHVYLGSFNTWRSYPLFVLWLLEHDMPTFAQWVVNIIDHWELFRQPLKIQDWKE